MSQLSEGQDKFPAKIEGKASAKHKKKRVLFFFPWTFSVFETEINDVSSHVLTL